jgi:hypothetical protein
MSPGGEAITFFLPVSIDSTRKDRVLTVEWLQSKLAETGTQIPTLRFATVPPRSIPGRASGTARRRSETAFAQQIDCHPATVERGGKMAPGRASLC